MGHHWGTGGRVDHEVRVFSLSFLAAGLLWSGDDVPLLEVTAGALSIQLPSSAPLASLGLGMAFLPASGALWMRPSI